jgi:hypothetical protein
VRSRSSLVEQWPRAGAHCGAWLNEFMYEVMSYHRTKEDIHDDQVDALAHAYNSSKMTSWPCRSCITLVAGTKYAEMQANAGCAHGEMGQGAVWQSRRQEV